MRTYRIMVVVAGLLALLGGGCRKSDPNAQSIVPMATGTNHWGSVLHVDFQGMITHDVKDTPARALLVDSQGYDTPHEALMMIPGVADSKLFLQYVSPQTVRDCSKGCTVNIDGLGIQFVDDDGEGKPLLPQLLEKSPDFFAVPHLLASAPGHTFTLTADATKDFPPNPDHLNPYPGRRIAAFVEMSGGLLSVLTEFSCNAHFTHENDEDKDSRAWPDIVRLTAYSKTTIQMQIKGPGTEYKWKTIKFADPTGYMKVSIVNRPKADGNYPHKSHFMMYQKLSDPVVTISDVKEWSKCHRDRHDRDTVAGCSNSTFP